nr:hypothetical protein [uncultured Gellertiella sp.]
MHSSTGTPRPATASGSNASAFPDRDTVAEKLAALSPADRSWLQLLMETVKQDENLFQGIEFYLNRAAGARFLHTLKLEACGEWLGNTAPARLQIRLSEIARSSHHPAWQAFRTGVTRSGGLERAYPKG